ncbi:hypothetical protein QWY75_00475 [Pontixanthobacter aestiaquae]|uniref:Lipoprotein n=1 Tax=Pontixanthobacter aestiaquae TaxID=1509367 RepID=A0A844ZEY7_9SPHN|nr:hypothetical protein [Pontixanthobacter aestiaquae]MDN3644673.1 hypothetical protein [Pontixanthobacter aestiaquae]MXO84319.1 hypothetical protein [Pontixanthobacter aestiaquae]
MTNLHRSFILGCSALALAGCGAEEIASPGTGGNITINNPPAAPTPTPTPTPASTATAATACPFIADPQGLTNRGVITGPTGSYLLCQLPARFNRDTQLQFTPATAAVLYLIDGQVDVGTDGGPAADASDGLSDTNVTLTIDPGVTLVGLDASYLNVNRGNEIQANGTAARPIIFTSQQNVLGQNTDTSSGDWGGLIINGRAPVTDCLSNTATPGSVDCEREVEGTTTPPRYGGNVPTDSSGSVSFVQLRYSGTVLANGDELQALTTGGVGSGTQFENIMSFNSADDGVEFFGGLVNIKGLVVVGAEDDSIDTDTGVKANLQYVVAVQRADTGDTIIEADSSNTLEENTPRQNTQISNATFIQRENIDQVVRIRGRADYALLNTIIVDASSNGTPCLRIDGDETLNRAASAALDEAGPVNFQSLNLDCATDFRNGSGGTTAAGVQTRFNAGTNNNAAFTNTLSMTYLNGANEDALVAFDPTGLSSFFENAGFVGAARATDTRFEGWTCDSVSITFGNNSGACTSLPVYTS